MTASMMDPNALFQKALSLHRSGELAAAAAIYRSLLGEYPDAPQLLTYCGIVALQLGEVEESVLLFDKSLAVAPGQPLALSNRGLGLFKLNRLDEALASYDAALALQPDYAEAHFKRGNVLMEFGRFDEALGSFERAIALQADHLEAHLNRGIVLRKLQRLDEALAGFDQLLALKPDSVEGHNHRGAALQGLGRLEEALASYERVLALKPDHAEGYNNRGTVLHLLCRFDEALASYGQALALGPDHVELVINRGETLQALGRLDEALAHYDQALASRPHDVELLLGRGNTLRALNRLDEALACADRAAALRPDDAMTQWNRALLKIQSGDYEDGWRLYEWGWRNGKRGVPRTFSQRLWLGEDAIAGETLLIYPEQGLGDFIQFCRYVPLVSALGARVILETPAALVPLVATMKGAATVVAAGRRLPAFERHCPLLSLPLAFRSTLDTLPAWVPYLHAGGERRARWRRRLGQKTAPRVGVAWSGNPRHNNDRQRSIPLALLQPLFDLPLEFHALQNDIRESDLDFAAKCGGLRLHRDALTDFAETAALAQEMDVIVSVDTAVAHLAGAMAKDVWILLPFSPDYRWMLDRTDSPWYPTARLFRQNASGDWRSVIEELADRLRSWGGV